MESRKKSSFTICFFFRCSTNSGRLSTWRSSSAGPEPYHIEVYGRRESGAEVPVAPAQTKPGWHHAFWIIVWPTRLIHIYIASSYTKKDMTSSSSLHLAKTEKGVRHFICNTKHVLQNWIFSAYFNEEEYQLYLQFVN